MGTAKVVGVPKDVEFSVGGRGGGGGVVVDGEGEKEVELDTWVDGDIGEFNVVELGSYVFSE